MSNMKLTRRGLFGLGATLLLPSLELFEAKSAKAGGDACTTAKRFLGYFTPHGWRMSNIVPVDTGSNYTLPKTLLPLADHKNDFLLINGLHKKYIVDNGHTLPTAAFLTGHNAALDKLDVGSASVDQLIADKLAGCAAFPSLQLGNRTSTVGGDGNTPIYQSNISWLHNAEAGLSTPLPPITDAREVFDKLFAGLDPNETEAAKVKRRLYDKSVLDQATSDVDALEKRLGAADRARLDEYLTAVRAIEQGLDATVSCEAPPADDYPAFDPTDIHWSGIVAGDEWLANHERLLDIMVLAFRCDATRVITFMGAPSQGGIKHEFLGSNTDHHDLSHPADTEAHTAEEELVLLAKVEEWQTASLATLIGKLKDARDAEDKPLLDSTLVYFSSESGDGNGHGQGSVPVILAGGVGGFQMGQHVRYVGESYNYDGNRPMSDLFISILNAFDVEATSFGEESTGPINDL